MRLCLSFILSEQTRMNKIITFIVCLCCAFTVARAEGDPALNPSDANIVGHVVDRKTGEHLSFITIFFEGDDDRDCDRRHRALLSEEPAGRSVYGRDEDDGFKTVETPVTLRREKRWKSISRRKKKLCLWMESWFRLTGTRRLAVWLRRL